MSDQNPYAKLGVSEDASFDEIQDARRRLLEQHSSDAKTLEMIEAAYDAILMERLRLRQEGKIKVPERIRFPDMKFPSPSRESSVPRQDPFVWLQRFLDRPTAQEIYMPGALYLGLTGTILFFYTAGGDAILQLALVLGAGISVYFLNRKENKFGRSVLLTLFTLVTGLILGGLVAAWLLPHIPLTYLSKNQFSTVLTFVLMWLVSSFLR
jgi:hypothetical protein